MSKSLTRLEYLISEIKDFKLGHCSPSDDPDKISAYLYAYKDIIKRFRSTAIRMDDKKLNDMVQSLKVEPEYIEEAYDLNAEVQCIIDYIEDHFYSYSHILAEKPSFTPEVFNKLLSIVTESLSSESANNLSLICENYGLAKGTTEQAFKSKRNYVYSRVAHFDEEALWSLAKKMIGKYPSTGLDEFVYAIRNSEQLSIDANFENIKSKIISEIRNAKYLVWVAVAWFTDRDLANELYVKKKQGLNVQIITIDDEINKHLISKISQYFETYQVSPESEYQNIMHHKFCVIDMKKVIHGSYNWTVKAQYNNETITVSEGRAMAEIFADEFLNIKRRII
ncbi:MAG: DUF1669 domain-containing protein [Chlorobiaceae bacterium]|nr:DUF1669 domain-containing protein [Chlorobiaceae bacterium]